MLTATACPSCQIAEQNPRTGYMHTGCKECAARALAQSPEAWKALHAQTAVPLQDAIDRIFGIDNRDEGRRKVWQWIKRINQQRQQERQE